MSQQEDSLSSITITTEESQNQPTTTTPSLSTQTATTASSESISEEEYLEKLHEKYSQTPKSELSISSFSTFGAMTFFHDAVGSGDNVLTPKETPSIVNTSKCDNNDSRNTDDFVDLEYENSTKDGNSSMLSSLQDIDAEKDLLEVDMTDSIKDGNTTTEKVNNTTVNSLYDPSPIKKCPPPFNKSSTEVDVERVELAKFHLPPIPLSKKKLTIEVHPLRQQLATITPPSVLKLIQQQYNIYHHNTVHLSLSNKNQKVVVPMINSNVTVLARSASLDSSMTSLFHDKINVRVFQNVSNVGTDDLYLSTQNGMQRITPLELDENNPTLCLRSLEDILFFTTVLPLSNFSVEEIKITNETLGAETIYYKVKANDSKETQIILFTTDTHLEISLNGNDEFIVEDLSRVVAFHETLTIQSFKEFYLVKGSGSLWLRVERTIN
ncbi:hypothetical protein C9374_002026 [Naegleria lovaniensis]|uniref:Uncharacterized protein n=1 Tax=Naegleria lovaniensis TaxID=51637 RepID=A0AA88GW52_NAELO|nr:uncharacterized protein C9374_002026 [Naegleria lovaniensis]KAG2386991.1 hypothetical protein C9374_002026 [Naegleria lovaniensis]